MYLRIKDTEIIYPYSLDKLKEDNFNISFPSEITESLMNEWDIHEVRATPKPNDYTKNISEDTPILVEGVYYQNWIQTNASELEIQKRIENKWIEIRTYRDQLLAECDWTQVLDSPQVNNESWKIYRQSLRDVTNQSSPFEINWPVKP